VLAKCGGALGCHYDGDFSTELYNVSGLTRHHDHEAQEWIIAAAANGLQASIHPSIQCAERV